METEWCPPEELKLSGFKSYLLAVFIAILLLQTILQWILPASHHRKYKAAATNSNWRLWADFYHSWLVDTFMRARAPKSIKRTTLLLSAYFLLTNLSEPCWRLLMRLRILVSKEVVENWVRSFKKIISASDTMLVLVFDNCDFHLHVTHTCSNHRSSYIHLINSFIVEIPHVSRVLAKDLWNEISNKAFGRWMKATADESEQFSESCWKAFLQRPTDAPLCFLYNNTLSRVHKSDVTILEPLANIQTLSYAHVELVVNSFFQQYIQNCDRTFAFVSGDQQVWIKLWLLRMKQPLKYHWMIPVPGEWHWTWHILKAIYAKFYDSILLPFAK